MITAYRQDPAWQAAQADYINGLPRRSSDESLVFRIDAARRMYRIERANSVVSEAPPLTDAQLSRIAALLHPAGGERR